MSIFKSAELNWPEDEAAIIAEYWAGCAEDGYTIEELAALKTKDIAHMERVFSEHSDGANLIRRFHAALNKQTQPQLFA